jgi:hypothetical protein
MINKENGIELSINLFGRQHSSGRVRLVLVLRMPVLWLLMSCAMDLYYNFLKFDARQDRICLGVKTY